LASAAFALWFYGFEALDRVWYMAGLGLLALVVLALLVVIAAALRMRFWLKRTASDQDELAGETERELATRFSLPSLRFWLFVDVRLDWLEPEATSARLVPEGRLSRERVRFLDHGEFRRVVRCVELRDVFGLASISLRAREPLALDVLPHLGALGTLPVLWSLAGGDDIPHPMGVAQGDRLELKRYAPGDPARFIHWKVFARTQKLMVRVPERALSRAYRVAAFLAAGAGDGASAACARAALQAGALGAEFRFGADGSPTPESELSPALVALRRSSQARQRGGADLGAFIDQVEREGPCALVLFVPPSLGAVGERVRLALSRRRGPMRVVIGVDGVNLRERSSWLERVVFVPTSTRRTAQSALRETMAFYQRLGAAVVVVDRESGRLLGDAHLAPGLLRAAGEAA
jgi:uncharacterized protein (DUF58 family)